MAPVAFHWILLYMLRGPQARRDFDFTFFRPRRWGELVPRLFDVLDRILRTEFLAALIPLCAILIYFFVTRRGIADALLLPLSLQLLCYILAFSASSFDPLWAAGVSSRLGISLFPAFTLVLAARLPEFRQTEN